MVKRLWLSCCPATVAVALLRSGQCANRRSRRSVQVWVTRRCRQAHRPVLSAVRPVWAMAALVAGRTPAVASAAPCSLERTRRPPRAAELFADRPPSGFP